MTLSSISSASETYQMLSLAQSAHMDKADADQASRIFKDKDTDGSGGLSLDEMGGNQALFDLFDANKDGVVSPGELQQGLKKIREQAQGQAEDKTKNGACLDRVQGGMNQDGQDTASRMAGASDSVLNAKELAAYSRQSQPASISTLSLLSALV